MSPAKSLIGEQSRDFLAAVAPRYAEASVKTYEQGLKYFLIFCEQAHLQAVNEATDRTLRDFESWLRLHRSDLAESTLAIALRSAKLFLKWAYSAGLTLFDGRSFSLPNPDCEAPKPPTVAVMKRLLGLPKHENPVGLRDKFALELLYSLGLRRAECCRLNLSDLNLAEETLRVVGKGGDERLLPVNVPLKCWAQKYLFQARPKLLKSSVNEALFITVFGHRLSCQSLNLLVRKYGKKLGLKLSTHHLRHACATHLVEQGMELALVQLLLGHRSPVSTKRYAQISKRELEREFRRFQLRVGLRSSD